MMCAGVWIVIFFVGAVFGGRVEQCLVKLEISGVDVEVVIPFDVSVHKVRLKVVFGELISLLSQSFLRLFERYRLTAFFTMMRLSMLCGPKQSVLANDMFGRRARIRQKARCSRPLLLHLVRGFCCATAGKVVDDNVS